MFLLLVRDVVVTSRLLGTRVMMVLSQLGLRSPCWPSLLSPSPLDIAVNHAHGTRELALTADYPKSKCYDGQCASSSSIAVGGGPIKPILELHVFEKIIIQIKCTKQL